MAALEKLSIDTPEQIALEFQLATIGSRFLALAIDTLIQIGAAGALFVVAVVARLAIGPFMAEPPSITRSVPSSTNMSMACIS